MKEKPDYTEHRKRLRQKYARAGLSGLHDYEMLELILTYCIPRRDTKPLAKALLRKFNTLGEILDADEKELESVPGMGENSALFLRFLKDVASVYFGSRIAKADSLSSPKAVYDYLTVSLKGKRDEELRAIFLNSRNNRVGEETIHVGTVDRSAVYPRKVVERALKQNAVSVIIAHNHPGGSLKPSQDDIDITAILKQALQTVNISLLDHVIISNEGYFSFREKGLIGGEA